MAKPTTLVMSCSSLTCRFTYDVFLSFRGEDTRFNFTSNLYHNMDKRGIRTFIDDEGIRRGEEIRQALQTAIQESRFSMIVFSKNYASSTFCLDELVMILEHSKAQGRLVWPIFYDVDPSEVRNQNGSYSEALAKHEERFQDDKSKVNKWREALNTAANLSGWHFKHGSQSEYKLILSIIKEVNKKLNYTLLHVADNPVGLECRVLELKSLIGIGSDDYEEGVNMVGMYGIGGIGKTTLARALYSSIADHFDGLCFLADIRKEAMRKGKDYLVKLQKKLLSKLLGEKDNYIIGDVNEGIPIIRRRLQRKKVLLVLDDVDSLKQLKAIAGGCDWFGSGSQIIITSRDKQLLATHGVNKFYEVKGLNKREALELFSWNAFKCNKVDPCDAYISSRVLAYAGGLPLALEVIGCNLYGKKIDEWCSALDKYEKVPNKEVYEILKVSYDGLDEDEKNIFLDIACFFNKSEISYVKEMLHARGFHPEHGIRVLIDKSLMKIDRNGCVRMHDLIQDMGKEIVRQESTSNPGKRSRLWFDEDIFQVLQNDMGTDIIEFISLYPLKDRKVRWNGEAFKRMRNLRVLIVQGAHFSEGPKYLPNSLRVLDWSGYPSPSLPSDFHPNELIILSLRDSCIRLDKSLKMFDSLIFMDFENCKFLRQVPDLSGLPNLMSLCLNNCTELIKIHHSVVFLDKLCELRAQGCIKLDTLGYGMRLPSLEILDLRWCTSLQSFPEVLGVMEKLGHVYLDQTAIEELPFSIKNLIGLERLYLKGCTKLSKLPCSIGQLPKLVIIVQEHRPFRLSELASSDVQENIVSSVFMCTSLWVLGTELQFGRRVDHNDFIQGRFPDFMREATLPRGCIIERKGSSVSFWFRRRFPKVTLLLIGKPEYWIQCSVLEFRFCVLINGTNHLTSSCDYIISKAGAAQPLCICIFLGDLQFRIDQGISAGSLPENEWNHVEVSFELIYHTSCDLKWLTSSQKRTIAGTIKWSSLHVYQKITCMEDIQFTNPYCVDRRWDEFCYCSDVYCNCWNLTHKVTYDGLRFFNTAKLKQVFLMRCK